LAGSDEAGYSFFLNLSNIGGTSMDFVKLLLIFTVIIIMMRIKKPLFAAIAAGALGTVILYQIHPLTAVQIAATSSVSQPTVVLVLSFYSITFLQRMLEKRGHLLLAEASLTELFNNRRINAMIAPFIIGLLPSPSAIIMAAPIVDNAGGEFIDREEKAFVASYFRHISEAFLPTYASIILALQLSGVDMAAFVIAMLPMMFVLFVLGYLIYVRRIPVDTGVIAKNDKLQCCKNLGWSLWTIGLTIALILLFRLPVYLAVLPVVTVAAFVNRFGIIEIASLFVSAVELKMMGTAVVVMIFKDVLAHTGVVSRLPEVFATLPVPSLVIFAMIFFFGTIVAGSQAIIALGMPMAFAAIPDGGLALMVLLMCITYISMQISPAHICLAIVVEVFDVSFLSLVRKTLPVMGAFLIIAMIYSYFLWTAL
jgi:uncharacterized protein